MPREKEKLELGIERDKKSEIRRKNCEFGFPQNHLDFRMIRMAALKINGRKTTNQLIVNV